MTCLRCQGPLRRSRDLDLDLYLCPAPECVKAMHAALRGDVEPRPSLMGGLREASAGARRERGERDRLKRAARSAVAAARYDKGVE